MIVLSERAARKLKEIVEVENLRDHALYVRVLPGGGGALAYDLYFDNAVPSEHIKTFECHGIPIRVEHKNCSCLAGMKVDYAPRSVPGGFCFENPNDACPSCEELRLKLSSRVARILTYSRSLAPVCD